ncbi:TPA: hypothetical protein NDY72_005185, partial [Enterobacter cloacae]|nr:hypothetical protein [Enterobacter cloacae]
MDRIKYLKWIAEESPTTAQQLVAWLNRARHYTPDMKEHQAGVLWSTKEGANKQVISSQADS